MPSIKIIGSNKYKKVYSDYVEDIRVTGWDLTEKEDTENKTYLNIQQTYYCVSHYLNSKKTKNKITIKGSEDNDGIQDLVVYGLDEGQENKIEFEVSYSYEVEYSDGDIREFSDSETVELQVYTRNEAIYTDFWRNETEDEDIASGKYISDHITESNVEDWLEQLRIWKSWKEQSDYSSYYKNNYRVDTGDDITADWYNRCAVACEIIEYEDEGVTGLSDDPEHATYIEAAHFIDLAKAVTDWT